MKLSKIISSLAALTVATVMLTSCGCCDNNPCCAPKPCCPPPRAVCCPPPKPVCCPPPAPCCPPQNCCY